MKPVSIVQAIVTAIMLSSAQIFAQVSPQERPAFQINRLINTAPSIKGQLSKNLYRVESYQAPYIVEVPYTDTETYTVEVPYQATESYYEDVPYTRDVPYTDYETYYESEYRCQNITRTRRDCHTETKCYVVPGVSEGPVCQSVEECGVNARGERICKTREVCKDGGQGEPQQRCEDKQICENVPYTDRECNYVNVPRTRQVTKYRQETYYVKELRSHTVTKYRTENRTRQVTKYRQEQKCCETKTRQVFDRQLVYNVTVQFPVNATLIAGENEVLNINLVSANLQTASVSLTAVNTIYGYTIARQQVSGANINVELALVPKFDMTNAGPESIQNLKIDFNPSQQKFQVSFNDLVISSKIRSNYQVEVFDLNNGQLIEKLALTQLNARQYAGVIQANLPASAKLKAVLKVQRTGAVVINSGLNFQKTALFEKRNLISTDIPALKNGKNVTLQLIGQGLDSKIIINDATTDYADVNSEYAIYLDLITGSNSKPLNMKIFNREALKSTQNAVKLSDIIQSLSRSQQVLTKGQKISFDMVIYRKGNSPLLINSPIKTSTAGSFIIQ